MRLLNKRVSRPEDPLDVTHVLLQKATLLIPLLLSLAVHEYAHAWSALRLGDDTAARTGRFTLNPFSHVDLFGTILLPLLGLPFGWAKPVPVDPVRFRRDVSMAKGMMITASAGPAANVVIAVGGSVLLGLLYRFSPATILPGRGVGELLNALVGINVNLALFNVLPVPPLDGSRFIDGFLPTRYRPQWERALLLSPILLFVVVLFADQIIAAPSAFVLRLLGRLLDVIAT